MWRCIKQLGRDESGTAITEAALVMLPLVFFLMIMPAIALIWASEQHTRTSAHRDMFDKTTTIVLLPAGDRLVSGQDITERQRRHVYPQLSGASGFSAYDALGAPDPVTVQGGWYTYDLFEDGFPDEYVEGWKYRKFRYAGGWWTGEMELMRYGSVIRSPWTWLGYPCVPTQDCWFEPQQIQGWYDDNTVIQDVKDRLKLVD